MARTIDEVEARLAATSPWLDTGEARMQAAVSLVLRERGNDLEALFIRRAEFEGDPWSGHIAFPGGRIDPGDAHARAAAERETVEEVGLDLARARRIGRLSDVLGHAESIRVSAWVYAIDGDPPLQPNYEIREVFWSPLHHCTDPERQAMREFSYLEHSMPLPTIRLLEDTRAPVLWGITYKFMDDFMARIGRPIPFMPWEEHDLRPDA
ncbi:MAG TPA: CoA pyrophosphatase [Myxococcota bacterium]|nr:CoA pyrophosphatase [Myxococcales bacterium]HPG28286.1 CoA pyrophosphatase [Myxococcota bacterium]